MNLIAISYELIDDVLLPTYTCDSLFGYLAGLLVHPFCGPTERFEERAVPDGSVWAGEDEVFWHVGTGHQDIALGLVRPLLCKRDAVPADDGKVGTGSRRFPVHLASSLL